MITTRVIPPAEADSQVLLVEIIEQLCRKYCINASLQPSASVAFTASPVRLLDGFALTTITAVVTVNTPVCQTCGCATTQVFTERFDLAFTATTANTITIAQGDTTMVEPAYRACCMAKGVKLTTTLTVSIA